MSFLTLGINMDDVILVLQKVSNELTILIAALVLAVIATFAVIKLQKPMKKLVRGSAWVAFGLVVIMVINMIVGGPLYSLVNLALREATPVTPSGDETDPTGETGETEPVVSLTDEVITEATELCVDLAEEGIVLLKNDGVLPLASGTKVNTFGWSSINPIYGGVGSGALSTQYPIVSYLDGLVHGGLEYNTALTDWYKAFRENRPDVGMWAQNWTCPEPTQADYDAAGIYSSALAYSKTALFIVSRSGGEGADLPTSYDDPTYEMVSGPSVNIVGDSEYADDLDASKHYLELTNREIATLTALNEKFENIIVIVNCAAAMELGFIDEYENIKAAVLVPGGPGQAGFNALGDLLTGKSNFSGKTVDIFVKDLTHAPTWNNFGHFAYDNVTEFMSDSQTTNPTFVNYVEGIYVGYRYWETAADEGFINYDEEILYPFGYGLSYTTFKQELVSVTEAGGTITATVKVTNTGSVAGKEVVQMYYNPPYTNGGVEKSTANLVAFAKTNVLKGGEDQTLTLTWKVEDMASYDDKANGGAGAWVVEAGNYIISLNSDSHNIIDEETLTLSEVVGRESDKVAASNQLQFAENEAEVTYLSRKDKFANYAAATAAPTNFSMSAANKAGFYNHVNYVPTVDPADEMPVVGANKGIMLKEMRGIAYDDPAWEIFLDQLTVQEMVDLIAYGGYQSTEIRSIGKTVQIDCDGPASINNNFTGEGSIGFTSAVMIASTWNEDLAYSFGEKIGKMADMMDVSGWYAPAMNIHRTAFSGRNFEYYSEDGFISGKMAAAAVRGAESHGVYSFIKHFAINDQETNRTNMMCTWLTEQSAREIFMKSFELAVKEGGADAVMTAFNYVGNQYAGASDAMLNKILRDEWGFIGMTLTDYFGGYGYQDADIQIRNGGDFCLSPMGSGTAILDDQTSATAIKYARQSCKNILYVTANCRDYAGEVVIETPTWQIAIWAVSAVLALGLVGVELILIKNYKKRVAAQA